MKRKDAADVIKHLDELRERGPVLAVLYMRESTHRQKVGGNLRNRVRALRGKLKRRGVTIVGEAKEAISGRSLRDRTGLERAIELARRAQAENPDALVVVVTDTRNRFVRGPHFNGQSSTEPPTAEQWAELAALAGGVTLATLHPPDASADRVRRYEGAVAKKAGRQNGRPPGPAQPEPGEKKSRRERLKPRVLKLMARGESQRAIARRFKLPLSTVRRWSGRVE